MQVSHEHDLHLIHTLDGFVDRDFIRRHMDDARVDDTPYGRGENDERTHAARDAVHFCCDENMPERQHMTEQQPQKIRGDDREQHIQQHAQPVVSDEFHCPPEFSLRQEKRDDNGADQKRLHRHGQRPVARRAEKWEPRLYPTHHTAEQIVIRKQIHRRKKNRNHVKAGASPRS